MSRRGWSRELASAQVAQSAGRECGQVDVADAFDQARPEFASFLMRELITRISTTPTTGAGADCYLAAVSLRVLPALATLTLVLTGCASTDHAPRQAVSTFTCCRSHDVNRVYHPWRRSDHPLDPGDVHG